MPPTIPPCCDATTDGCSGAEEFFRCAVTYRADARVVPRVSTAAPSFNRNVRMRRLQSRDRSLEERDLVEGRAQDLVRIRAEVAAQDLLVNGSEVDGEPEVARGIQAGEAGLRAVQPALHRVSDQEQGRGRAVVGAAARVLF